MGGAPTRGARTVCARDTIAPLHGRACILSGMRRAPWFALCLVLGCGAEAPLLPPPPQLEGNAVKLETVAIDWERQPVVIEEGRPDGVPISLTSGDGAGLAIVAMRASAVIEDPLAFTELHMTFKNPEPRAIEGRFEITLPPNATISRFAMKQTDGWQEGEVVELEAAREAYEDALHRRVDPALLEKQAGNRFQARVFPIPPSGEKELIFSYSQELTSGRDPYRVYLRGLPEVGKLDLRVVIDKRDPAAPGRRSFELSKVGFTPDRDLVVPLPAVPAGEVRGLRSERLAVARITPVAEAAPDPLASALVLFDTSASRALGFKNEINKLAELARAVEKTAGAGAPFTVIAFDQTTQVIHDGTAGEFGAAQLDAIRARGAFGASNFGKVIRAATALTGRSPSRHRRIIVMSDGVATAGASDLGALKDDLAKLKGTGVERVDGIVGGGIRDEGWIKKLTVSGFSRDGVIADGARSIGAIVDRLQKRPASKIAVNVPGSAWVWPSVIEGVLPGDQTLVYTSLPAEAPFTVELGGSIKVPPITVKTSGVEKPLLERAMVNAEIQRKMSDRSATTDPKAREEIKQQIILLSTKYRVLSDFTALLVLETDADYARFKIDRRALADILTVGGAGIEVVDRRPKPPAQVAAAEPPPEAVAIDDEAEEGSAAPRPSQRPSQPRNGHAANKGGAPREVAQAPAAPPPAAPPPGAGPPPPPPAAPAVERSFNGASGKDKKVAEKPAEAPKREARPMSPPADAAPPPPPPPPPPPAANARPPAPPAATARPSSPPSAAGRRALVLGDGVDEERESPRPRPGPRPPGRRPVAADQEEPEEQGKPPYQGKFADVMSAIESKRTKEALAIAQQWHEAEPGDALALIAMGEAFEALGNKESAARAYGSLIDLFPGRADLRRYAGVRLERLGEGVEGAFDLVVDTYRRAAEDRPDHPASHRLYAYALVRAGKPEEAFEAILAGSTRGYPPGRFRGVDRILWEDTGIIGAALIRAKPEKKQAVLDKLASLGVRLPKEPSLRFVLIWETDANDVDFHIRDGKRGHAFYSQRQLPSGGELYADVTTGYGPECFTIEGRPKAYPYKLKAHYYARGPMGYGMGKLEIMEHDGRGGLKFEERPYVVMVDHAFVDLGVVKGPLK